MQTLRSKKLPLAWFLICVIATAAIGIVLLLVLRGSPPSNAVLIESHEEEASTQAQTLNLTSNSRAALATATSALSHVGVAPSVEAVGPASTVGVYVSGAVNSPGVYTLTIGSRVADAIKAAGGATEEADLDQINLAALLSDEEHIVVPRQGEIANTNPTAAPSRSPTVSPAIAGAKLDLNSATASELEALPGIGPVLALRIVQDRDRQGPFRSVEELTRVSGIKEGILSQVREYLTVSP